MKHFDIRVLLATPVPRLNWLDVVKLQRKAVGGFALKLGEVPPAAAAIASEEVKALLPQPGAIALLRSQFALLALLITGPPSRPTTNLFFGLWEFYYVRLWDLGRNDHVTP